MNLATVIVGIIGAVLWLGMLSFFVAPLIRGRQDTREPEQPLGHVRLGIDERRGS